MSLVWPKKPCFRHGIFIAGDDNFVSKPDLANATRFVQSGHDLIVDGLYKPCAALRCGVKLTTTSTATATAAATTATTAATAAAETAATATHA